MAPWIACTAEVTAKYGKRVNKQARTHNPKTAASLPWVQCRQTRAAETPAVGQSLQYQRSRCETWVGEERHANPCIHTHTHAHACEQPSAPCKPLPYFSLHSLQTSPHFSLHSDSRLPPRSGTRRSGARRTLTLMPARSAFRVVLSADSTRSFASCAAYGVTGVHNRRRCWLGQEGEDVRSVSSHAWRNSQNMRGNPSATRFACACTGVASPQPTSSLMKTGAVDVHT